MAYQDENLVANCYSIPVEEAWQFNAFFVKRGGLFQMFLVTVETTEKICSISTLYSQIKI